MEGVEDNLTFCLTDEEILLEGEGEVPAEGEVMEGEGESPVEGEGEAPVEGEGEGEVEPCCCENFNWLDPANLFLAGLALLALIIATIVLSIDGGGIVKLPW